ncbi:MAG: hypothetical protein KAJ17_14450 [Candidatus Krumholzibacteria bacterium]|nr:hypothetical protein [Candidatus Krumholzibacteria bacterium]
MKTDHPIDKLAALSRKFGPEIAIEKNRLLKEIDLSKRLSARRIKLLHDTLYFMRAYPDNEAVLRAVMSLTADLRKTVEDHTGGDSGYPAFVNTGLPGSQNTHSYSYGVVQRLVKIFPGSLDIDWEQITYEPTFVDALNLVCSARRIARAGGRVPGPPRMAPGLQNRHSPNRSRDCTEAIF